MKLHLMFLLMDILTLLACGFLWLKTVFVRAPGKKSRCFFVHHSQPIIHPHQSLIQLFLCDDQRRRDDKNIRNSSRL